MKHLLILAIAIALPSCTTVIGADGSKSMIPNETVLVKVLEIIATK